MSEEEKAAPVAKVQQNGETQPAAGTKTRRVWDIAQEISEQTNRPALRSEVLAQAAQEKINNGTAATQYGRWTKFHGLTKEALNAVRESLKEQKPAETPPVETPEAA